MSKYIVAVGITGCVAIALMAYNKIPIRHTIRDLLSKEMPLETVKSVDSIGIKAIGIRYMNFTHGFRMDANAQWQNTHLQTTGK